MLSFFTLPSNDQSYYYLGNIFGNVGTVLQATSDKLLFGVMFKSLNTTALILGAILVTYTTVVGLLKTAKEGEFLGKQWDSLWVPLRMVIGIASLFPTAAGYSVLQIVLMWIIVQGIGAADSLWTVVLEYIAVAGSPYASVGMPTTVDTSNAMQTLFQELTCHYTASMTYPDTYPDPSSSNGHQIKFYYCADGSHAGEPFCTTPTQLSSSLSSAGGPLCNAPVNGTITCKLGPSGACGTMTYGDPATACANAKADQANHPNNPSLALQLQCVAYTAQQVVLQQVVSTLLEKGAVDLGNDDYTYMQFYNGAIPAPDWVKNYCSDNNIPAESCCMVPAGYTGTSSCQKQGSAQFPDSNNTVSGYPEYTNAGQPAMNQIIWPCAIAPIVAGQQNPTGCITGGSNTSDFVDAGVSVYSTYISTQVANELSTLMSQQAQTQSFQNQFGQAQAQGWIMAGSIYYQIANMNNNNLASVIPPLKVSGTDPRFASNNLTKYRNNYSAAGFMVQNILSQNSANQSMLTSDPKFSQVSSSIASTAGSITTLFFGMLTGGTQTTNPLVSVQHFGESILDTAEALLTSFIGIVTIILLGVTINLMALGNGLTVNPGQSPGTFVVWVLWSLIISFEAWAFGFGGLLAVYTPLVPYIIFTFGAVGWFFAAIEAMVAAPFVALGILSPGGQHEILGRAEPAIMIIMSTFLRPTLMIIGMMAAMLVAPQLVSFVNAGFQAVMGSIVATPGLMELICFISAYTMLILSILNKTFALIHLVPDKVLTWIGGHAGSSGADADEALKSAKGGVEGAGAAAGGLAKSSQDTSKGGAMDKLSGSTKGEGKMTGKLTAPAPGTANKYGAMGSDGTNIKPKE